MSNKKQKRRYSCEYSESERPGFHCFTTTGSRFEVGKNLSFVKPLGTGAYGVVVSAKDSSTDEKVAIKKVPSAFEDLIDAKRILREVKLLRHFDHENIINIRDLVPPPR